MKIRDAGTWTTTVTPEEGRDMCVKLRLLEMLQHGDDEYIRFTQKGINVLATLTYLLQLQADAEPDDILRGS